MLNKYFEDNQKNINCIDFVSTAMLSCVGLLLFCPLREEC